jgi:DNA-binding PadR family transcriptional regulator
MSTTRLLVLGVVRIFQPVHGYFVRRELLTWRVEEWAHVNPGSIYGALRTLVKEGHVEEVATDRLGNHPERTTYRLTVDGEAQYLHLLRDALWSVDVGDPSRLLAALSFMPTLNRQEVIDALTARRGQIDGLIKESEHAERHVVETRLSPAHVIEHFQLRIALLNAERAYLDALGARLADGHYHFADEPGGIVDDDGFFTPAV